MCHEVRLENPRHHQQLLQHVGIALQLRHPREEHPHKQQQLPVVYVRMLWTFVAEEYHLNHDYSLSLGLFTPDLAPIVHLKLVPWGNAKLRANATFDCQVLSSPILYTLFTYFYLILMTIAAWAI